MSEQDDSGTSHWVNDIHQGDAVETLAAIPENRVHFIVTSPPYNLGVGYDGYNDDLPDRDYADLLKSTFQKCHRILVSGGRLCVVVGLGAGVPCDDKPSIAKTAATESGFKLRDKYVWDKGTSESSSAWGSWRSPSNPRQIYQHEEILVFYKDSPDRSDKSGKTLSKTDFLESIKSVWKINPVTDSNHPATFPVGIPHRLIKLYSFPDDLVVDPFAGLGTTCVAAKRLGRSFIGVELSPKYVALAQARTGLTVDEPVYLNDDNETLTAFADGGYNDE